MAYLNVSFTRKQEAENTFVSWNETVTSPSNVSAAVYQWHIILAEPAWRVFSAVCSSAVGLPWAGTDRQTDSAGVIWVCSGVLSCRFQKLELCWGKIHTELCKNNLCCLFKSLPFILKSSHLAWCIPLLKMCSSTTSSSQAVVFYVFRNFIQFVLLKRCSNYRQHLGGGKEEVKLQ